MASDEVISYEIPELLEIKEQDLRLINEVKPFFSKKDDLYVIIAREINIRKGINNGDLRVGIIRVPDPNNNDNYELALPFCKNLIYATIEGERVRLSYVENKSLKVKEILINSDGRLNYEDYAFLLDNEPEINMGEHILQR